jgi:DNA helicase HerA-like ATPase
MKSITTLEVLSIPSGLDPRKLVDTMLGSQFMLCHDLPDSRTFIITESDDAMPRLSACMPGLKLRRAEPAMRLFSNATYMTGVINAGKIREGESPPILRDIYDIFSGSSAGLLISFSPITPKAVKEIRRRVEEAASKKTLRLTKSFGNKAGASNSSDSVQMELFYGSDEQQVLLSLIQMLTEISLSNGTCYKVSFIAYGDSASAVVNYVKSRVLVLEERRLKEDMLEGIYEFSKRAEAMPLPYSSASRLIEFSPRIARETLVGSRYHCADGSVEIGDYLAGSVASTNEKVSLDPRVFNLGTVISGVPGTGKTNVAMNMVDQIRKGSNSKIVVISPTSEWNQLGVGLGAKVIRLYSSEVRFNLFKCDSRINIERFYENLSMLLASASNAGPYKNSMEKSLLYAFQKAYSSTRAPDPIDVYEEIENAVAEQHGKRVGASVRYTKHGENIMAGLENLRLMLFKEQFAYQDGIDFARLIDEGAVFDLSEVSNNMKPFFYALILNQVYSIADSFDEMGNESLRLAICLEEAQLVFGEDDQSAATMDLKQRIQDFRKKGIGLFLITHNITEISIGIRRLCQIKLYFRQSSDTARYACSDLLFTGEEEDTIRDKLKSLDQGVCALSYITIEDSARIPRKSIFVKASQYLPASQKAWGSKPNSSPNACATVTITDSDLKPKAHVKVAVFYIGEMVYQGETDDNGLVEVKSTLPNRPYKMHVFGAKKKDTRIFGIIGGKSNAIRF